MIELDNYLKARDKLIQLAHRQYTPENCPLNSVGKDWKDSHYSLAEVLFGRGYVFTCELCGQEFDEWGPVK